MIFKPGLVVRVDLFLMSTLFKGGHAMRFTMKFARDVKSLSFFLAAFLLGGLAQFSSAETIKVTLDNFPRAESHLYMGNRVKNIGIGVLGHNRMMVDVDNQRVMRMNRDTQYSSGVFDLAAGDITITLPETQGRYLSVHVLSEEHYTSKVIYEPGEYNFSQAQVGSRYAYVILRILADSLDKQDMKDANDLQDQVIVSQNKKGVWQGPKWNENDRGAIRQSLKSLVPYLDPDIRSMFGGADTVDPTHHLLGTAAGWGGLPREDAMYQSFFPDLNDGDTAYQLTLQDVPVGGFWSVSVYNAEGYFAKNDMGLYSANNLTARPNEDGSYTINFGGDEVNNKNYLPITPGWSYTVRLYQPGEDALSGAWKIPVPEKM